MIFSQNVSQTLNTQQIPNKTSTFTLFLCLPILLQPLIPVKGIMLKAEIRVLFHHSFLSLSIPHQVKLIIPKLYFHFDHLCPKYCYPRKMHNLTWTIETNSHFASLIRSLSTFFKWLSFSLHM